MPERLPVMTLFGTRPEAIKLAPVVLALAQAPWVAQTVAVTGQHREMLDQVLALFDLRPDADLALMSPGLPLAEQAARALAAIAGLLRERRPRLLIVQGDTASAFAGALAAFYEQIPVAHVEAGLRTHQRHDPFPEEVNRRLISAVADLHFAPTERARAHLLAEGVPAAAITVTGNTEVDALRLIRGRGALPSPAHVSPHERLLLVTLHRREHWGARMAAMCGALRRVLDSFPDTALLFPMHRNPVVRAAITAALGDHPRVRLVEPLDYLDFVGAMAASYLILTDSGGVQESAPALGKPVLVLRETTERPEAIQAGTALLVGTDPQAIEAAATRLLTDGDAYAAMARAVSPFGDGHAAERIVTGIHDWAVGGGLLSTAGRYNAR